MVKGFIAIITECTHSEAIGSNTDGIAPPSEFITHDIAIDFPSTSVRTVASLVMQAKANRVI